MGIEARQRKAFKHRRNANENFFEEPLHKRFLKWVERSGESTLLEVLNAVMRIRPMKLPVDLAAIKSVLIIRNDAIGDMILSSPMWHVIKRRYPHIRIGIVGSFRNLPVIEYDPFVDVRIEFSLDSLGSAIRARREVQKHQWDLVLPLIYSKKTKVSVLTHWLLPKGPACMVLLPSESPERYRKMFEGTVTAPDELGDTTMSDLLKAHLALTCGIEISDEEWRPEVHPNPASLIKMQEEIASILQGDGTKRVIHINLDAKTSIREYGLAGLLAVSKMLTEKFNDFSVVWTCSPEASASAILLLEEKRPARIHFVTTGSIHDLMALVRFVDLVITPDTSVVHMAAAERKPIVGLYIRKNEWQPSGVPAILLVPKAGAPISSIRPFKIVEAVEELLNQSAENPQVQWRRE
jgi:ADP-heptose:LPS heptosyltransferase